MLKLPKRFHPEFSQPGRKPARRVEIDWSNSLARGLFFASAFNDTQNLVTKKHFSLDGQAILHPAYGARFNDTTGTRITITDGRTAPNELTILAKTRYNSTSIDHCLLDVDDQDLVIWADTYSGGLRASVYAGTPTLVGTTSSLNGETIWGAVVDGVSNTAKIYVNGAVDAAGAIGAAVWNTKTAIALGANVSAASKETSGDFAFVYIWDRQLTDAEMLALSLDPYQILKPANDLYYFVPSGAGGATEEAFATFSQAFGMTLVKNAEINASALFTQSFGMAQGGNGAFNCSADYATQSGVISSALGNINASVQMSALIDAAALSIADMSATISASISSGTVATVSAITNAEAVINIDHAAMAAGGLSLNSVAEFAVNHTIQADSDISIEALADFGMSCGLLCAAITEANAEINVGVVHSAVSETLAMINAQANYGITSGLSVTRTIITESGITCSITSSFTADGALQVEGVITTPAGRTMRILAENRTMRILLENRTMKIPGDNNGN